MRASETTLLEFIRRSPQFLVPVSQRGFAWMLILAYLTEVLATFDGECGDT